jgi:peroxiredoxin
MSYSLGDGVPAFTLPTATGDAVTVDPTSSVATVVVFTSNHCPYALAWHDRLQVLARDYAARRVSVVQINSNDEEIKPAGSTAHSAERVENGDFAGPYLRDADQGVAAAFGAQRTPEVSVIDASGTVVYHGAPDADFEDESQSAAYLRNALDDVLEHRPVERAITPAVGCTIKWGGTRAADSRLAAGLTCPRLWSNSASGRGARRTSAQHRCSARLCVSSGTPTIPSVCAGWRPKRALRLSALWARRRS